MQSKMDTQIDKWVRLALAIAITYWSFILMYPLLGVLAWGFILAVAFFPIYSWMNPRLGGSPVFTATLLTLINLLIVISALIFLADNMAGTLAYMTARMRAGGQVVPWPPADIKDWPLVGEHLHAAWSSAADNFGVEVNKYSGYLVKAVTYTLAKMANVGIDFLSFIISVMIAGYLMTQGGSIMTSVRKFADRVALARGSDLISVMKETILNVSRGVIGISLLQALLFGLVLLAAQAPAVGALSLVALILCIIQVGLFLLSIPLIVWLFLTKSFVYAMIITILLTIVTLLDSFLKPIVLSRGLRTPMAVIFLGVIGGVITYGLIGVFIGPVVLAVFYDLVHHWLNADEPSTT